MIYFRLVGATLRAQLRYRTSFLLDTLASLAANGVEFVALALTFTRFGALGGWTVWEVGFLWGLTEMAFGTMDLLFGGFDPPVFGEAVRRGTLDQFLARPVNLYAQIFASQFALRRLGRVAEGLIIFLIANRQVAIAWTPLKAVYLPVVFASAVAFYGALFVIGATASFWTVEGLEIVNIFTYGGATLASYPLSIFDEWIRRIFTYVVPTALIVYFPALYFFDRPDPLGMPAWASFLAPLAGFGLLALAFGLFRQGLRRYTSTGT